MGELEASLRRGGGGGKIFATQIAGLNCLDIEKRRMAFAWM